MTEHHERRRWTRHELEATAELRVEQATHLRPLGDLSGGGASIQGAKPPGGARRLDVALDDFGAFSGSIVRDWDDGFAVAFDLEEDDRYSLQEDIDSFMRENDLMDN